MSKNVARFHAIDLHNMALYIR